MSKEKNVLRKTSSVSSSGYGFNFEHSVQSFFVVQMFTGGFVPRMGAGKIVRIVPQSSRFGRETDDCEVTLRSEGDGKDARLLVQIKKTVKLTKSDKDFTKTIADAWLDFTKTGFDKRRDRIMLIAGDLDGNGTGLKRMLLFIQSAYSSSSEFWRDYENGKLGRSNAEEIGFERLIERLTTANNNTHPDKSQIFDFCKIFHIIKSDMHDANFEDGDMNIALVHSALSGYRWADGASPFLIWQRLHSYISEQNQYGTAIHLDNLPEKLLKIFATDKVVAQEPLPTETNISGGGKAVELDNALDDIDHKRELALLCVIGGFDSSNESDLSVVERIFGESRQDILRKVQSILNTNNAVITLEDTTWRILNPYGTLTKLSDFIYDNHIDVIEESYLKVLGEIDPALDLPADERHMASLRGKSRIHSKTLRHGLAEGMAILSCNNQLFTKCSLGKISSAGAHLVQSVLQDYTNPDTWASLSYSMEAVAWTSPKEFLSIVERTLSIAVEESPIAALSKDSNTDWLFGVDYLSGVRRSLLNLAKNSEYFVRSTVALGVLAAYEKEESHESNHSLNFIVELVLPWHPKTQACSKTRYTVVEKILIKNRNFGRYILKQLLPGVTQTTVEDNSPPWILNKPEDLAGKPITQREVYEQSSHYSLLYIDNSHSAEELIDVIESCDHLTDDAMDSFAKSFVNRVGKVSGDEKREIWSTLLRKANQLDRLRSNTSEAYAGRSETILSLADKIAPEDEIERSIHLFSNYDYDLVSIEDWKSGESKVREERGRALLRIVSSQDLGKLHQLIESAKFPHLIGATIGAMDKLSIENRLLPAFIRSGDAYASFYKAYIYASSYRRSDDMAAWVEEIDFDKWSDEEKTRFILSLPLGENTWRLLRSQPSSIENKYWSDIQDFVSISQSKYSSYAVSSLLKANRPLAALECIYWASFAGSSRNDPHNSIDNSQVLLALIRSIDTSENVSEYNRLNHEVETIFNYLHSNTDFTETDLWRAEWAYLAIFRSNSSVKPKALIQKIVDDAGFFCELIQIGYRSANYKEENVVEKIPKNIQHNLLRLLSFNDFPIIPGVDKDGVFHETKFTKWVNDVERLSEESGHLGIVRSIIGGYIVRIPEDPSGIWINRSALEILDRDDAIEMRQGYNTGVYNARGIHSVDVSGSDEAILRDTWRRRADQADEEGYMNVASSLRDLADGYEYHRERVARRGLRGES